MMLVTQELITKPTSQNMETWRE